MKIILLLLVNPLFAQSLDSKTLTSEGMALSLEKVYAENDGPIWSIEFLNDQQILFSKKSGQIKIYDLNKKKTTKIKNPPPSHDWGQGGLLDLCLHPDFQNNSLVYISYTKKIKDKYTTAVMRAQLSESELKNHTDIFVAQPAHRNRQHFGSRLAFDKSHHLFVTVGDRGERKWAQNLETDIGKIHRLQANGSTPKDNPFVNKKDARKSIWSYGHRNPQGLAFDPETDTLWAQEHGPQGGDEINNIKKGHNYGWPEITHGREYDGSKIGNTHKKGMETPFYHYVPSIAPSGLEIYRGQKFPKWEGDLFSGALKLTHLNRLKVSNKKGSIQEERLLEALGKRIRDVKRSPDGLLYFSTDSGEIYRLSPSSSSQATQ